MGNRRYRRLVTPEGVYHWIVRHRHTRVVDDSGRPELRDCRETLLLRREDDRTKGRVEVVFRPGEGKLVGDTHQPGGTVVRAADHACLNLNRPGTVRALADELWARGTNFATSTEVDGWDLFDVVWEATRPTQAPRAP